MQTRALSASTVLDLIRPRADLAGLPKATKLHLTVFATLVSLGLAALWGAAAGSCVPALAAGNLVKVPLVVLLSALAAAPLGVVAWKLLGEETSVTDLLLAHGRGLLAGSLVLGTLVPIVALYYHSSQFAGPLLADATAFAALAVGIVFFVRFALKAPGSHNKSVRIAVPATMIVLQGAAMVQLIALASPILPDPTMFRDGIDGIVSPARARTTSELSRESRAR